MKNDILLSIVVPMYNVAHYLERCLRSLHQQDIPATQYEIICVNDGSPDNCKDIVENLQKEISNIVLINQVNQGVSMARNNAMKIARGKYLLFVDADDYVSPNALLSLIEKAENNNLDIVCAPYEKVDSNGQSLFRIDYSSLENRIDDGCSAYYTMRGNRRAKAPDRSWGILYKVDLIRKFGITFPQGVFYLEDGVFTAKIFQAAQRVGYSNRDFYFFYVREGSATNSDLVVSDKALNGFKLSIEDWFRYNQRIKSIDENAQHGLYNFVLAKYVFHGFFHLRKSNDIKLFKSYSDFLSEIGIKKLDSNGVQGLYKKLIPWFNISVYLLYFLIKPRMRLFKRYGF
jgi:glycosyltransferase involved in cell wall biosynthesis